MHKKQIFPFSVFFNLSKKSNLCSVFCDFCVFDVSVWVITYKNQLRFRLVQHLKMIVWISDIYEVGKIMARNGPKRAICNSLFLCIRVYMKAQYESALCPKNDILDKKKWIIFYENLEYLYLVSFLFALSCPHTSTMWNHADLSSSSYSIHHIPRDIYICTMVTLLKIMRF